MYNVIIFICYHNCTNARLTRLISITYLLTYLHNIRLNRTTVCPKENNIVRVLAKNILIYFMDIISNCGSWSYQPHTVVELCQSKAKSKAKMCNGRRHVPLCPASANEQYMVQKCNYNTLSSVFIWLLFPTPVNSTL